MNNLVPLERIFDDCLFRIPDYQRGYAWGHKQCTDFIQDLELLRSEKGHFFGTFILQRRNAGSNSVIDKSGKSYTIYDVIDGQQRLTTVVLFLTAIAEEMARYDHLVDLVTGLRQTFLYFEDLGKQAVPKVQLNQDSHDYFANTILGLGQDLEGPQIRSHLRLREAQELFQIYLKERREQLGEDYIAWLTETYFKIRQRATGMLYIVESEADAGVIFETMNNRGKPITELEKVKNYLLYVASKLDLPIESDLAAKINKTWQHIFESLMSAGLGDDENENRLLRSHWLMAYDHRPAKWRGSNSIKERFALVDYVDRHQALFEGLCRYVDGLRNATTAYADVLAPTQIGTFSGFHDQPDFRRQLVHAASKLVRLGAIATFLPLLIATRLRFEHDAEANLTILVLCERYAFRTYRWLGARSNAGQNRFYTLGFDLYQNKNLDSVTGKIRRAIHDYCSDYQFAERFSRKKANWYSWSGLKYFLYEYEEYLAAQRGLPVKMPWEELAAKPNTIEHILPQTPNGNGYWLERFSEDEHVAWVNDIGNLSLTYDNSVLSNRPFRTVDGVQGKQEFYKDSFLFIERLVSDYQDWTPDLIQQRRHKLEEWAKKRWHVDPPSSPPPVGPDRGKNLSIAKLEAKADERGIGSEFRKVLAAARRHGLHPRPWSQCVMFAPQKDRRRALILVYSVENGLVVYIWYGALVEFFPFPKEEAISILGPGEQHLDVDNTTEFVARLDRFFLEVHNRIGSSVNNTNSV